MPCIARPAAARTPGLRGSRSSHRGCRNGRCRMHGGKDGRKPRHARYTRSNSPAARSAKHPAKAPAFDRCRRLTAGSERQFARAVLYRRRYASACAGRRRSSYHQQTTRARRYADHVSPLRAPVRPDAGERGQQSVTGLRNCRDDQHRDDPLNALALPMRNL